MRLDLYRLRWHIATVAAAIAVFVLGLLGGRAFLSSDDPPPQPTTIARVSTAPAATPTSLSLNVPLAVQAGQLIMAGFDGTTAAGAGRLISQYHLGNVVLLAKNIDTPEDVLAMTRGLQRLAADENGEGMLISIDQEGGRVRRLPAPWAQFPPAREIGCIGEPEFAKRAGEIAGTELLAAGINVDLAPVADVVDNPANEVIGDRAFGTTSAAVTKVLPAWVEGLRSTGVASTAKHFPGHGSTTGDSHDAPVSVAKTLAEVNRTQLAPYRAVAGTTDLVMMANVDYPAIDPSGVPAGLSSAMVRILRDDVGFGGVIVTDSLAMGAIQERWTTGEAAVLALKAGVDLILISDGAEVPAISSAIIAAVRDGTLSQTRIDEALARVLTLKRSLLANPLPALDRIGAPEHEAFTPYLQKAAVARGCAE